MFVIEALLQKFFVSGNSASQGINSVFLIDDAAAEVFESPVLVSQSFVVPNDVI